MADRPPPDFSLADALTPFSPEEVDRLKRYVERAKQLKESRFFQQEAKFNINVSPEGMTFDLPRGEDEELVTTMVARLRNLHSEGRPGTASFVRTVRMLRGHTEGRKNPSADWFRKVLDDREARVEQVMSTSVIGLVREHVDAEGNVVSTEEVAPDEPFWDWIYGVYLHDDEGRLARVQSWAPQPVHQFNFLQMANDLARLYYAFSGIVLEVLEEPALVPDASPAASGRAAS
jgi:hypothetical protein